MVGKTEEALQKRLDEVNGIIDTAYQDMIFYKDELENDNNDPEQQEIALARYNSAQKTYITMMQLLLTMTRNYDETVKTDTAISRSRALKAPKTALQKMQAKEAHYGK